MVERESVRIADNFQKLPPRLNLSNVRNGELPKLAPNAASVSIPMANLCFSGQVDALVMPLLYIDFSR